MHSVAGYQDTHFTFVGSCKDIRNFTEFSKKDTCNGMKIKSKKDVNLHFTVKTV